jgi:hypothetical protein
MALPDHIVETKDGKQAWRCENCFFYDLADWTEAEPEKTLKITRRRPARWDFTPDAGPPLGWIFLLSFFFVDCLI